MFSTFPCSASEVLASSKQYVDVASRTIHIYRTKTQTSLHFANSTEIIVSNSLFLHFDVRTQMFIYHITFFCTIHCFMDEDVTIVKTSSSIIPLMGP